MKYLLILLLIVGSAIAKDDYTLRVAYGKSTSSDLGEVVLGDIKADVANLRVLSVDGGYLLKRDTFDLPLDFYLRSSLSYYDEAAFQDGYGADVYIKAYYRFLSDKLRFGFGEGFSYTSKVLATEEYGAQQEDNHNTSKFLNYLDVTVDFDMGRTFGVKSLEDTYFGFLVKHRSGIFGLINNVKHGGSNYNCLYLEKKF